MVPIPAADAVPLTTVVAIGLGQLVPLVPPARSKEVAALVTGLGGSVEYDYEWDAAEPSGTPPRQGGCGGWLRTISSPISSALTFRGLG